MTRTRLAAGLLAAISITAITPTLSPAFADGGDAFRGKAYASSMCGGCHAVAAGADASPVPAAKPFREVKLEYPDAAAFAEWINTKHPPTHVGILKPQQADDIWAHINSLKQPAG